MRTVWLMLAICLPLAAAGRVHADRQPAAPRRQAAGGNCRRRQPLRRARSRRWPALAHHPHAASRDDRTAARDPLRAMALVRQHRTAGEQQDGWSRMLRRLAQESGMAMMRTEKAGVGDSEGDCASLDYETELADHRAALAALNGPRTWIRDRIVVFGASMGGNFAPLVAAGEPVAGVMIWGGGREDLVRAHAGLRASRQGIFSRASRPNLTPTCTRSHGFLSPI